MRRQRRILTISLLGLSLVSGAVGYGAVPARAQEEPAPLAGTTFPVGTNTFEPTIGADGDGRLFYSVTPGSGVAIGFSAGTFRSDDLGRTWSDVSPTLAGLRYPPETNDPYIYVDQTAGRVFQFHMSPILTCSMLAWTDDAGANWTHNPYGCGPTVIWDHQTMVAARPRVSPTFGYPNVVHECVNSVYAAMCSRSLNGGLTWDPGKPVYPNPGPQEGIICGSQHGHLGAAPDGTVYLPSPLCGSRPTVFVSEDDGLTWRRSQVANVNIPLSDPDLAVDRDGNVYVAFLDESGALFLSMSRDKGLTWGAPVRIAEGVTAGLPAVAAGDPGRVVVSFVGTDDLPQGYLTPGYPQNATGEIAWGAYLAVSTNMLDAQPQFQFVDAANGDPISRGSECERTSFRCDVQIDFLDVTIAPDGRPYAAFVDGCQGACVTDPAGPVDRSPPAPGIVATLTAGPLLCEAGCPWKFGVPAPPAAQADLGIDKSDSPDPVAVRKTLTYTLAVTNGGPDDATGVTVTDALPAGVKFRRAAPSQGSCVESDGVVTCELGTIADGSGATITIKVKAPPRPGTITNTGSVSGEEDDPEPANNTDSEETRVKGPPGGKGASG